MAIGIGIYDVLLRPAALCCKFMLAKVDVHCDVTMLGARSIGPAGNVHGTT